MSSPDAKLINRLRRDKQTAEAAGRVRELADACNALGAALLSGGHAEQALQEHQQELSLCEKLGDEMGVAVARRRIGDVQCECGEFDAALRHYVRYLATARHKCRPVDIQRASASIGRTYLLMAESLASHEVDKKSSALSKADKWLNRSLKLVDSLAEVSVEERAEMRCRLLLNVGIVSEAGGEVQTAQQHYQQALSLAEQWRLWDESRRVLDTLALSCQQAGQLTAAVGWLRRAAALCQRHQLSAARAETLSCLATVLLMLGDIGGAKRYWYRAYKHKHISDQLRLKHARSLRYVVRISRTEDELLLTTNDVTNDATNDVTNDATNDVTNDATNDVTNDTTNDVTKSAATEESLRCRVKLHEKLADMYSQLAVNNCALHHYTEQLHCAEKLSWAGSGLAAIFGSLAETCRQLGRHESSARWFRRELYARTGKHWLSADVTDDVTGDITGDVVDDTINASQQDSVHTAPQLSQTLTQGAGDLASGEDTLKNSKEICKTLINLATTEATLRAATTTVVNCYRQAALVARRAQLWPLAALALRDMAATLNEAGLSQQAEQANEQLLAVLQAGNLCEDNLDDVIDDTADAWHQDNCDEPVDNSDTDSVDLNHLSGLDEGDSCDGSEDVEERALAGGEQRKPSCSSSVGRRQRPHRSSGKLWCNNKGETHLHVACIQGRLARVKQLLDQGHPVNVRDHSGWLPLHEAANFGRAAIVAELLAHGAAVSDPGGRHCGATTPLHDAASNGHVLVVQQLLQAGASVTARNDQGMTPLQCLREFRRNCADTVTSQHIDDVIQLEREMAALLQQAGECVVDDAHAEGEHRQRSSGSHQDHDRDPDCRSASSSPDVTTERHRQDLHLNSAQPSSSEGAGAAFSETQDPAEMYRNAICSVGKSAVQRRSSAVHVPRRAERRTTSADGPSSRPALVDERQYEWLEDDLDEAGGGADTSCRSRSNVDSNSYRHSRRSRRQRRDRRLSCPLLAAAANRHTATSSAAISSSTVHGTTAGIGPDPEPISGSSSVEDNGDDLVSSSVTADNTHNHRHNHSDEENHHQGALSSGPARKRPRQTRLVLERVATESNEQSDCSRTLSPDLSAAKISRTNAPSIEHYGGGGLRVLVQLGADRLLIPVAAAVTDIDGASGGVTRCADVAWLCDQVSDRYHSQFLLRPHVQLLKHGALLASSDRVCDVIDGRDDILQCRVLRWHNPPLTDRYSTACKLLDQPELASLRHCLSQCDHQVSSDVGGTVDLSFRSLTFDLVRPVVLACQRYTCVSRLLLSACPLNDSGVKELADSLRHLSAVRELDLRCVGMRAGGLAALLEATAADALTNCRCLLLAHNLFESVDCGGRLAALVSHLPSLQRLDIASCQLNERHVTAHREVWTQALTQRGSLHELLVSHNTLGGTGVDVLLRCASAPLCGDQPLPHSAALSHSVSVPQQLRQLEMSACVGNYTPLVAHLLAYAARCTHGCHLTLLDLSSCHVTDDDVIQLANGMKQLPRLASLNLSFNWQLCGISGALRLLGAGGCSLRQLQLNGCDWRSQLSAQLLDEQLLEQLRAAGLLQLLSFGAPPLGGSTSAELPASGAWWRHKWGGASDVILTAAGDFCFSSEGGVLD